MSDLKVEDFSSFSTTVSPNKKLYLKQKWNDHVPEKYLELLITDSSNYWNGTCKFNTSTLIFKLYSNKVLANLDSQRHVEESSNLSNFDMTGIRKEFGQAFSANSSEEFVIELNDTDDFSQRKV